MIHLTFTRARLIRLIRFNGVNNMSNQEINREEQKKQTQKLVHRLVTAIDEEPDKFNNYYDLGALLTRLNDYEQAEARLYDY